MSGSDDPMSEPRTSSRPSLMERRAARTGYALPILDTELINKCAASNSPQVLTIPFQPYLSPTTLLDSPDFIPNSHIHPSPTTGTFVFPLCVNNRGITLSTNECNKEKISEDINGPPFAFQPVQEPANNPSVNNEEERSPPELNEDLVNKDGDQSNIIESGPAEDGYNWRKYGQKQMKGGEYPQSYYKCTYLNCPVKKNVEWYPEGHVTEIIYRGSHNHPKPPPNRRSSLGSTSIVGQMQSTLVGLDHFSGATHTALLGPNGATKYQSGDAVDLSSFSDDGNDDGTSLGREGEGDESESKRRKIESHASDMSGGASRAAIREPRVVVQTTSDVDILDDGYRWRKYGQKVVKGNPNPRSYYKCTTEGCNVRKHVERAPNDLKSVITTYEGKHNHDVPAPRNNGNSNQINRPVPSQISANAACRFDQMPSMGSFVLPNQPQVGPGPGFGFGMSQHGLARLGLSGLGPSQGTLPPYLGRGQPRAQVAMNEMSFMVPRELKAEAGLGSSSMYNQFGPQI